MFVIWFGPGKESEWVDLNRVTALSFDQYVRNWSSWKIKALWPDEPHPEPRHRLEHLKHWLALRLGCRQGLPAGRISAQRQVCSHLFLISFCCTSVAEGMDSRNGRNTQGSSSRLMLWPLPDCWWHFCSVTQNQKGLRRKHHEAWAGVFRAPLRPPALSRLHLGIWIAFLLKRFCDRKSETQWLWRVLENSACKEQLRK